MFNKLVLNKNALRSSLIKTPQLTAVPKRFEGGYPWLYSMAKPIPDKNNIETEFLDESEVITRMMFIMNEFAIFDLKKFDWEKTFADNGVDSLESTALLTSIEHEFHTIFEDRVFENFDNLNQVKNFILSDHNCF